MVVQQRKTNSPRRINIGMENGWLKFAPWWRSGIVLLEHHLNLVETALPNSLPKNTNVNKKFSQEEHKTYSFLSGNGTLPSHQVQCPISILFGTCNEGLWKTSSFNWLIETPFHNKRVTYKWMIFAPVFALFCQSGYSNSRHFLEIFRVLH